ncbi:MAG: UDP-glucose--hexose-1-phosphate uridylyltransferase [Elusimicrobiaceae bacterium]|nr:UDP-glucose--hexose-1-phosphate uridylyltransferase [Elusimicrobiaceae bacterium]
MQKNIEALLTYAVKNKLIKQEDKFWAQNAIYSLLGIDGSCTDILPNPKGKKITEILNNLSIYAAKKCLLKADTTSCRDNFEISLMGVFTARPSEVINKFSIDKQKSPKLATDNFYKYCKKINYIRTEQIAKNISWKVSTIYGNIGLTINLAKPEKDPKEIALLGKQPLKENAYPKCVLCSENEGYAGRIGYSARQNLRVIPLKLGGKNWFFQYSPFSYYTEHSIVVSSEHRPMKITPETFMNLLDFLSEFPHYFIGSNADLGLVGGSILNHDHYQAGRYTFALEQAKTNLKFSLPKFRQVEFSWLKWPVTVLRVRGNKKQVALAAAHILKIWQKYDDKSSGVLHATGKELHSTITPIARYKKGKYEIDLALRNNRTDKTHPFGIFNTPVKYHNIKRENMGLIEVLGLAVLPGRLKKQMAQIAELISENKIENIKKDSDLKLHYAWVKEICSGKKFKNLAEIQKFLRTQIGYTFVASLEGCGVFKQNAEGKQNLLKFIKTLGGKII